MIARIEVITENDFDVYCEVVILQTIVLKLMYIYITMQYVAITTYIFSYR